MGTIEEIERAIQQLPPEQLAKFRDWFTEFDNAAWDRQIEEDVAAGRLDTLGDQALQDLKNGHTRPL